MMKRFEGFILAAVMSLTFSSADNVLRDKPASWKN